jgi:hypothetical protein
MFQVNDDWTTSGFTFTTKPAHVDENARLAESESAPTVDVTNVITGDGVYAFSLEPVPGDVNFGKRDFTRTGAAAPTLTLTVQ